MWITNGNIHAIAVSGTDLYASNEFTKISGDVQSYFILFSDRVLPIDLTSLTAAIRNGYVELE